MSLNERVIQSVGTIQRRAHILVEFPEPSLESIVVQWNHFEPSIFVQLKRDLREPIQFGSKRGDVPNSSPQDGQAPGFVLDYPLNDFLDAATGKVFGQEAFLADILFSQRAFALLQPEPDMVLPVEDLWECRKEALRALGILDEKGTRTVREMSQ